MTVWSTNLNQDTFYIQQEDPIWVATTWKTIISHLKDNIIFENKFYYEDHIQYNHLKLKLKGEVKYGWSYLAYQLGDQIYIEAQFGNKKYEDTVYV